MPDTVQIRSFITVAGLPSETSTFLRAKGQSEINMTPQPNRYSSVKAQLNANQTFNNGFDSGPEESKGLQISSDISDILEELQNNQLQIYALWSEEGGDVQRSFIQQPFRQSSLNTISIAQNGRIVASQYTYGLPAMITNFSRHLNSGYGLQRKRAQPTGQQKLTESN